jgi:hypothetical protein
MSPTLQISLKNTFLEFSESPRPNFRRARTSGDVLKEEQSPISWASTTATPLSVSFEMSLSPSGCQKSKVLDNYVASVGKCLQTTVMIRGIPKSYEQEMLLAEVAAEGLPVNFLYLPPGKTKNNRSYGFVNFETEAAAAIFLCRFEGHQWRQGGATKVANVGYATLQGYEQNLEFFSKQEVAKGVAKRSPWVKQY